MDTPRVLLEHYLKQLRLPTIVREFPKLAEQCAKEGAAFEQFLMRLVEQEMLDRERRATERRIRAAKFPVSKSLETYDFLAIPSLNKKLVVELAGPTWFERRDEPFPAGTSRASVFHPTRLPAATLNRMAGRDRSRTTCLPRWSVRMCSAG